MSPDGLAAIAGLAGARAAAGQAAAPLAQTLAASGSARELTGEADRLAERLRCPGCGGMRARPARGPHDRCGACRGVVVRERVERIRTLIAAGVEDAVIAATIAERDGISELTARDAIRRARRR